MPNVLIDISRKSRREGYTLTEMLVAVGVMSALAATALVSVFSQMPEYRLESAASQFMTDLRAARMEAVSANRDARITVNASLKQYTIWIDRNGSGGVDHGEIEVKNLDGAQSVQLWTNPTVGTFHPDGTFSSSRAYWYISLLEPSIGYRFIHVLPSGHVNPVES